MTETRTAHVQFKPGAWSVEPYIQVIHAGLVVDEEDYMFASPDSDHHLALSVPRENVQYVLDLGACKAGETVSDYGQAPELRPDGEAVNVESAPGSKP